MTMGTILPQGGPSYAFTGQELYPGSSHQGDVNWPLSGNKLQNDNPQPQPQYPAPEHLEVPASQPYGYGSYDPLDVNRDHPLAQWPGIESLGRFPSMEKVVAGITNRPKTPSKRFLSMAKKSFESLRGRKNSRSEGDSEITGNTPLMPTVAPTHHGYGSSSQISLNSSSSQLPDEQTRYWLPCSAPTSCHEKDGWPVIGFWWTVRECLYTSCRLFGPSRPWIVRCESTSSSTCSLWSWLSLYLNCLMWPWPRPLVWMVMN